MLFTIDYIASAHRVHSRLLMFLVVCFFSLPKAAFCQGIAQGPDGHATLDYQTNGTINLAVGSGAWPEVQIVNRLKREYGWAVDYEECPQTPDALIRRADGRLQPKPRSLSVSIPQPVQGSSTEELQILRTFTSHLSNTAERSTGVRQGVGARFDIVCSANGAVPLLGTAISLSSQARSVEDTIGAILAAVSARTGQNISHGGIADSALDTRQVVVGGSGSVSARTLLAQALDALPVRHVWLLTYEPQENSYVFSVEPLVRAVRTVSGQVMEVPVKAAATR